MSHTTKPTSHDAVFEIYSSRRGAFAGTCGGEEVVDLYGR